MFKSIWEFNPYSGRWILHRASQHADIAEETVNYLNSVMQKWRKDAGCKYAAFPTGVDPNSGDQNHRVD